MTTETTDNTTTSTYTVIYEVTGDREKHNEWWRMIQAQKTAVAGITVVATAGFDALAKLDEMEGEGRMVDPPSHAETTPPNGYVTVNLNDTVRFRFLGAEGEKVWRDYWARYSDHDSFQFIPADEHGWCETQIHNLMSVIGHSFVGCFSPIETNIQVKVKKW